MGRADFFKIGDWNALCDRCGFKYKRSDLQYTWDNLLVCDKCWEPRHPQDFVRGRKDLQRVPDARVDTQTMQNTTTLSSGASKHNVTLALTSVSGMYSGTSLGIALDSGTVQWTFITANPSGSNVTINDPLWDDAASGNTVYLSTGDRFLTATEATATGL